MKKQTVWFLIIFSGSLFLLFFVAGGRIMPFQNLLAQIGITVGVAPNPYNTLDAQLNQEQDRLNQQASDLAAREAALASSTAAANSASPAVWHLDVSIAVIALLVSLNFYLDWRRSRRALKAAPAAPDGIKEPKE